MGDTNSTEGTIKNFTEKVTFELGLEGGMGICLVEKGERDSRQRAQKHGPERDVARLGNCEKSGSTGQVENRAKHNTFSSLQHLVSS